MCVVSMCKGSIVRGGAGRDATVPMRSHNSPRREAQLDRSAREKEADQR